MIVFYVVTNPRVLAKLRAEIAGANAPSPISEAQAKTLPYLQAVIKEGLRICPPITGIMFRDVPPEGDAYNGTFLPGGTIIGSSVMGVCMDKRIWGADAESFRPERFFEGSEDELREREAVADTAFGFGRWRCLGRNIALMELNKAVTEVSVEDLFPRKKFGSSNSSADRSQLRPFYCQSNQSLQELQCRSAGAVGHVDASLACGSQLAIGACIIQDAILNIFLTVVKGVDMGYGNPVFFILAIAFKPAPMHCSISPFGILLQDKFVQLHFLKKIEGSVANFLVFNRADILSAM